MIDLYNESTVKLTKEFNDYYPGGHSNLNLPWEFNDYRLFIDRCEGSRLHCEDGREILEFTGAMGPTLLGHRHPEIVQAIKDHVDAQSTSYGANIFLTTKDIDLAKAIVRNVPCAEQIKGCTTGTEAVQMAFRIARAYTGKNRILHFGNSYHGWLDNILRDSAIADYKSELPLSDPNVPRSNSHYSDGMSPWSREEQFVIPYNDFEALEYMFKTYHQEIAILIMEGCCCNNLCMSPKPGFLERIRELCTQYNVVLCFDEIITGWRAGLGGIQGYLGVTPDLCCMGKAVTSGIPFSFVAGKREIMTEAFQNKFVLGAGTYNGYALGVSLALKTIEILERNDGEVYKNLAVLQDKMQNGMLALAEKHGVKLRITGIPNCLFMLFGQDGGIAPYHGPEDIADVDFKFIDAFRSELLRQNIVTLGSARLYLSAMHTDADIETYLEAADKALYNLCGK